VIRPAPSHALPPGPSAPPLVQRLHWLFRPIPFLEECTKKFGPMFTVRQPGSAPQVFVSDPAVIKQIFTGSPDDLWAGEAGAFLKPILGEHSILVLDGVRHQRHRKLLMPPFHGERMQAYGETMREVTDRRIDAWPLEHRLPLLPEAQAIALDVILRTIFGLDEGTLFDGVRRALEPFIGFGSGSPWPLLLLRGDGTVYGQRLQSLFGCFSPMGRFQRIVDEVDRLLYAEIRRRRGLPRAGREDVLALLLDARDEAGAPMTDVELRDELLTLLIAGHETTATAIVAAVDQLCRHPEALARLLAELKDVLGDGPLVPNIGKLAWLDAVIKETLRLHPVLPVVGRQLHAPLVLDGRTLPAGVTVIPCIYLAHRRADLWPEPERFRPERFLGEKISPFEFFPFGGGARRCVGMAFASYELKIVLAQLLRRCSLSLAPGYRARIIRRGVTFALSEGVPIVVHSRR
jgi:cytochrome P450